MRALPAKRHQPKNPIDNAIGRSRLLEMKTDALQSAFETWWDQEGSAMPPMPHEDSEMFARRVSEIAWHNGAFAQRWKVGKLIDAKCEDHIRPTQDCTI